MAPKKISPTKILELFWFLCLIYPNKDILKFIALSYFFPTKIFHARTINGTFNSMGLLCESANPNCVTKGPVPRLNERMAASSVFENHGVEIQAYSYKLQPCFKWCFNNFETCRRKSFCNTITLALH